MWGMGKQASPGRKHRLEGCGFQQLQLIGSVDPEFECVVDVMLVVGHNHLGGLEYEEIKEIRLLTWRQSEEAGGRGSTHFSGGRAPVDMRCSYVEEEKR